jgi:response regulator RpfG family c-di-GMP phosphodiesterase
VSDRLPVLLIVDDEARILTALRRALRRENYEILTAETPAEALRVLDTQPVDLILSDHKMPGMSGVELLAAAARKQPNARRVLITGWTEEVPPAELEAIGVHALLPKPWDDAELKATLRAALETD